ncbi:hypothetical protein, partial [Vibrio parahaemolyticus]|uniref:hypothetical protein n=1 Tax=Vibrio parahaemolyticus TaxID=670 RepID=UPI00117360ED
VIFKSIKEIKTNQKLALSDFISPTGDGNNECADKKLNINDDITSKIEVTEIATASPLFLHHIETAIPGKIRLEKDKVKPIDINIKSNEFKSP